MPEGKSTPSTSAHQQQTGSRDPLQGFSRAFVQRLRQSERAHVAMAEIPTPEGRWKYMQAELRDLLRDKPADLVELALQFTLAHFPVGDALQAVAPADRLSIRLPRATRKGRNLVQVNGRKLEVSRRALSVLRNCAGASEVLADDRAVRELLALPELSGLLVKDNARARTGHSWHWVVSPRLADAIHDQP